MKNVYIAFIGACALFLVSCGDSETPESQSKSITMWHFWSEPGQRDSLRVLLDEFEQKYNCTVTTSELSWNDGKAKLQAAFSAGNEPDVLELGSDWVAQFSSAGVLAELPSDSVNVARFVPFSTVPGRWQGKTFAYPWTIDTRVLYVNTALLGKAGIQGVPTTLDELKSAAYAIHRSGGNGFGANGADANRLYKKILPFMWTLGGDVLNADGYPVVNSESNVKALELYAELSRTGYIETQRQLDAAFVQGGVGLWNSGSWLLSKLKAQTVPFAVALMPGQNGSPGFSFAGGEYLAVTARSSRQTLARQLIRYLTSPEQAVRFCSAVSEAGFPADRSVTHHSSLVRDPQKAMFAKQLLHARMTPVHPRWLDLQSVLEEAVVQVLYGNATASEALNHAQALMVEIVRGS